MHSSHTTEALAARIGAAAVLVLLLDYDGTLVPFAPIPALAEPDDQLRALLRDLADRPSTEVHVVSGRTHEALERWLGALPIGLHAEHGLLSRPPGTSEWVAGMPAPQSWRPGVLALMRDYAAQTPGALVEEKSGGVAWHYRLVEHELGLSRAYSLKLELSRLLERSPAEILPGAKVIEVVTRGRPQGPPRPLHRRPSRPPAPCWWPSETTGPTRTSSRPSPRRACPSTWAPKRRRRRSASRGSPTSSRFSAPWRKPDRANQDALFWRCCGVPGAVGPRPSRHPRSEAP